MEILVVVCMVVCVCGMSTGSPRHRAYSDELHHDTSQDAVKLIALFGSENSDENEHIYRHPRRINLHQPKSQTQHKVTNAATTLSPLLTNANARKSKNSLENRETLAKLLGRHSLGSHEEANLSDDSISSIVNYTEHSYPAVHKRKNIFQLIKHLELALDIRKRKDRPSSSKEEPQIKKFLKKPSHTYVPSNSDIDYKKRSYEKNYIPSKTHLDATDLKNLLKNHKQNRKNSNSIGHIQKIGRPQKSEEDWINVATKEIKADVNAKINNKINRLYNSNDVSLIKSIENEDLNEHAIAKIIKKLRDILAEDIADSASEDADENVYFMQTYVSPEPVKKSNSETPVAEKLHTVDTHTDYSSFISSLESSSRYVPSISYPPNYTSVVPLVVDSVNSGKSSSVESESAISSSESSGLIDKSNSDNHKNTDNSNASSYITESQESYSAQRKSRDGLSSSSYQSQNQASSSVENDSNSYSSTVLSVESQSNESKANTTEKSNEDKGEYLYHKYDKILAEKAKNDSLELSNKIHKSFLSSNEHESVLPLLTTAAPILTTRVTETTELENILNTQSPSERSGNVDSRNADDISSDELSSLTNQYAVIPSEAMLNVTHIDLADDEILRSAQFNSIPRDVSDALANILLSDNDVDLSSPDQKAIDSFFEEIAQEFGETAQLVADATASADFVQKVPNKRNVNSYPRSRHDRAIKTYNLAFHFNK